MLGSLWWRFLGQPGALPGRSRVTQTALFPVPGCSQCPLALTIQLLPPSTSTCLCSGLVTPLVSAVAPQGAVQNLCPHPSCTCWEMEAEFRAEVAIAPMSVKSWCFHYFSTVYWQVLWTLFFCAIHMIGLAWQIAVTRIRETSPKVTRISSCISYPPLLPR